MYPELELKFKKSQMEQDIASLLIGSFKNKKGITVLKKSGQIEFLITRD